jgi:hypothetical protein
MNKKPDHSGDGGEKLPALTTEDVERQYRDGVHIGSGLPRATCPCGFCQKHRYGFNQASPVPQDGDERVREALRQLDRSYYAAMVRDHKKRGYVCGNVNCDDLVSVIEYARAALAQKAVPIAVAEPVGYLHTFCNPARPHDPIKRFSTYRFQKPHTLDETVIECIPLYANPPAPIASASLVVPDVWRTKEFVMSRLIEAAKEPPSSRSVGNSGRPVGDVWRMVLLSDLQEVVHHLKDEATHPTAVQPSRSDDAQEKS